MAAAVLLALASALGALGTHALQYILTPSGLSAYEVAVRYQFFHGLGLFGMGLAMRDRASPLLETSAWLVLVGVVIFSGSIYALCFGAPRFIGFATPLGGIGLISGWLLFALGYWRACGSKPITNP